MVALVVVGAAVVALVVPKVHTAATGRRQQCILSNLESDRDQDKGRVKVCPLP